MFHGVFLPRNEERKKEEIEHKTAACNELVLWLETIYLSLLCVPEIELGCDIVKGSVISGET